MIVEGKECKVCGNKEKKVMHKGTHIGLYCSLCDTWERWLNKEDKKKYGIENLPSQVTSKNKCCKEGEEEIRQAGVHLGVYCKECGKWKRWESKRKEEVKKEKKVEVGNCCKEGEEEIRQAGVHLGVYCKECGKWKRWESKKKR